MGSVGIGFDAWQQSKNEGVLMEFRIDNTFETLSKEEWDKYLGVAIFENMIIDTNIFPVAQDLISQMVFQQGLVNYIRQHNNKVGTLNVSYALCRHYFDKGIPDDPWYISPGKDGQSIQYMPEFQPKHWLIRYWFSYFSEAVYFKLFSIWDSVIGFINEYYQMDHTEDLRFKSNVLKSLKAQRKDIAEFMANILQEKIYQDANMYRTRIIHGSTPSDVSSGISIKRNTETEIYDRNEDGSLKFADNGMPVMKKVKGVIEVSSSVGEYTGSKEIMDNIEQFAEFTGDRINHIMNMISKDTFHI